MEREPRAAALFGTTHARRLALDLLDLLEFSWHDCYEAITPLTPFSMTNSC